MVFKILSSKANQGLTIVEVVIVISVTLILLSATTLTLNPASQLKTGRDNRRANDLAVLNRIILEHKVDTGSYPDSNDTLRSSNVLPSGANSLASSNRGWINANLSQYNAKLPLDPLNSGNYVYKYVHTDETYELSTLLETSSPTSSSDGGNDSSSYELGNNLTLISP
jgi:type II secretory pathway pseudopilin PulG